MSIFVNGKKEEPEEGARIRDFLKKKILDQRW